MTDNPFRNREVIFETTSIGNLVKISAIDTRTMTEISMQGPANTPEALLRSRALKKLEYVMRKKGLLG
jgi:hypothetical protein